MSTLLFVVVALVVVGEAWYVARNGAVWTPIPESVVGSAQDILSGSTGLTLWRLVLLALLVAGAVALASLGWLGATIAGILIGALISDDVRAFVRDLWNLQFWEVSTS